MGAKWLQFGAGIPSWKEWSDLGKISLELSKEHLDIGLGNQVDIGPRLDSTTLELISNLNNPEILQSPHIPHFYHDTSLSSVII